MGLRAAEDSESRFVAYVEGLTSVIGHADREGPLRDYCTGLDNTTHETRRRSTSREVEVGCSYWT